MSDALRFGRCMLRLLRREVVLDGAPQRVAPKVFDLLVLLVRNRERVLTKQELRGTLWPGEELSDSVIARTVMKARRAIGDSAAAPLWIRSVHGVGYRFVGDLHSGRAAAAPSPPAAVPGLPRVGVLPCANASGESALDWARLGLMSLLTHALESDPRLDTVPVATLLEAMPRAAVALAAPAQAQLLIETLGLDHALHAVLHRHGDALWVDYHLFCRVGPPQGGSFRHADPLALCEGLAQAVLALVLPDPARDARAVSRDPFVNQAFARAADAVKREDHAAAAPLLALVANLEPDNLLLQTWHARSLIHLRDPTAEPAARALLARAVASGNARAEARAHVIIVMALLAQRVPAADALLREHAEAAERLAVGHEREDWYGCLLFCLGAHAHARGDLPAASGFYGRAEAAGQAGGNEFRSSVAQQGLAMVDVCTGDLRRARERLELALRQHRRAQQQQSGAHALGWLAVVNMRLGLLDVAFAQCEELLATQPPLRSPGWIALPLSAVALVYTERAATGRIERVLALFEPIADHRDPMGRGPWLAVRAALAACRGERLAARTLLQAALEEGLAGPGATAVQSWVVFLLRLQLADADFAAVAQLRERVMAVSGAAAVTELRGALLHAQAAEHHHRGERAALARLLESIVEQLPPGRENACARLDAAWLCIERGELAQAEQLMAGVNAWCQEHPVGLATQARLWFERGDVAAAAAAQRFAVERQHGRAPPWHAAALRLYEAAVAGMAVDLPALPTLVSDSWLPPAATPAAAAGP